MLNLLGGQVTDLGLSEITGLKGLTYLNLADTHVTDRGLKELQGPHGTHTPGPSGVGTDEALKQLQSLANLRSLDVGSGSEVTDVGLKGERIPQAGEVELDTRECDRCGLEEMKHFKSLVFGPHFDEGHRSPESGTSSG